MNARFTPPRDAPPIAPHTFNRVAIHAHLDMLHTLARGANVDGVLVLACYGEDPVSGRKNTPVVQRFAIGDVGGMVDAAMAQEGTPHLNVYVPWHIMRHGLVGNERGGENDLRAILALPVDLDEDTGKAGKLPLDPPYSLETSAGNFQPLYPLTRALLPNEAQPLATALQAATGSDHGTKDLAHVWRVPGTLNWPNKKKADRGRPLEPQAVRVAVSWTGELIDPDKLRAVLGEHVKSADAADDKRQQGDGATDDAAWQLKFTLLPASAKKLIVAPPLPDEDRSATAASAIFSLIRHGWPDAAIVAVILAHPEGIGARYADDSNDIESDVARLRRKFDEKFADSSGGAVQPIDLWAKLDPPPLPRNVLPKVIENFAFEQGKLMGADPAGLAMAALATCAAAIPDRIKLQAKVYDTMWTEAARLWVALIGPPSTKKSPILRQAARPLARIDGKLFSRYMDERAKYDALPPDERKRATAPKQQRLRIEDATIEAAQEVLRDSPDGVLCLQDELSGWFGSMDKYAAGRGAAKDRGFWLQAFNGGQYAVNRISRGPFLIPNLSVSVLGGIQPEPLRAIVEDAVDDGLLQRLCPIMLRAGAVGLDEKQSSSVAVYETLIERLRGAGRPIGDTEATKRLLHFSEGAQAIRRALEQKHLELMGCEAVNKKLAAHIGKYDGIFVRLCLIWHCIEHAECDLMSSVSKDIARRVNKFLHGFLLPHATAFYAGVLGLSDDHERLTAVAGYILAHKLQYITNRDIQRGDRTMRKLGRQDIAAVCDQLEALGWVCRTPGLGPTDPPRWDVNPNCHAMFERRAASEAERRTRDREMISTMLKGAAAE